MDDHLYPSAKELRALRLHVSQDVAHEALCRLWMYGSEGGLTYVASDGHTMVVPSDPLDGWFWSIHADAALWSGVIMPRRV
jgi:hypothetical protein